MALRWFWRRYSLLAFRKRPVVFWAQALSVVLISRFDDLDDRAIKESFALYKLSADRTSSGRMSVGGLRVDRLFGQSVGKPDAGVASEESRDSAVPFSLLPSGFVRIAKERSR
eukprot:scaffold39735_cov264-Isochrysis_galbana.AAC.2